MKYISLRSFEDVSSALNFVSDGLQVVGGCDLYTTKAAGGDKKLYKKIDKTLEARHESLLRLAASLSPPQAAHFASTSNLSQSSPFGPLTEMSNRRTYAYMIATLNASHPDYDFSHVLRPSDFCREKRIRDVMNYIDSKITSARPNSVPKGLQTPGGSLMWGPRMWSLIDMEMELADCEIYSYRPEENPFDDEETALWSLHYFFFNSKNKHRKRVCYLYARALSPTSVEDYYDDDDDGTVTPSTIGRKRSKRSVDFSAKKRARYWLGDRADDLEDNWFDDANEPIVDDDEADVDVEIIDEIFKRGRSMSSNTTAASDVNDEMDSGGRRKGRVRTMSEGIAEGIEL